MNFREVHMDTEQNLPYSVLLTKIDVGKGTWGLFNFYKMQVSIFLLIGVNLSASYGNQIS